MEEWIDINDKLPEFGVDVLCLSWGEKKKHGLYYIGSYHKHDKDGHWFKLDKTIFGQECLSKHIAFWMPLPALPQAKEGSE